MKVTQIWKLLGMLCIVSFLAATACDKDDDNNVTEGKATMRMHLTDAPAAYDAVYVDVQEIEVHSDNGGWVTLTNIKPGIYNLLDFRNGLDTLIAVGEVPSGKISQIRLILGPNNSVVENGITHSLKTPSAQQSGLKLNVNYTLQPGLVYEFWLDFDASRSIVAKGNGDFNLKPVIKVFTKNTTGSIEGFVDPSASSPVVIAYNTAGDTATAFANSNGYFLLGGLSPSSYTVDFDPIAPYNFKQVTGVAVTVGNVTDMGTIIITQ